MDLISTFSPRFQDAFKIDMIALELMILRVRRWPTKVSSFSAVVMESLMERSKHSESRVGG